MLPFIARRLLAAIPVLVGIAVLTFLLARVIPGDACTASLGERATAAQCDAFRDRAGLDEPLPVQLGIYLGDLARGDLGESITEGRPVRDLLVERLPVTLELSVLALALAIAVGVPLGVLSARRQGSAADVTTMVAANLGVSTPVFLLGLFLQVVFARFLRDTPLFLEPSGRMSPGVISPPFYESWGIGENGVVQFISNLEVVNGLLLGRFDLVVNALQHLVLPAVALATIPLAVIARMTRSSLLDVLGLDYVRTARAKGAPERLVVTRHALRNALLPVVTVIGLSLGTLIGGAILTETIFNLTGVGSTLYRSITGRDYTVVQGFTLVIAVAFVVINLLTDLLYTVLDPKVRPS